MFALINRQEMSLVCKFEHLSQLMVEHHKVPFVVLDLVEDPSFRVFTELELKLLYRSMGMVSGMIVRTRPEVVAAVTKLLSYKLPSNPNQNALFTEETSVIEQPTGRDRAVVGTVATTPKGGVRSVIWEHADSVWSNAGKPLDKGVVMQLRKQMMTELEAQGIKKTSSSNELGNWMKARVPS